MKVVKSTFCGFLLNTVYTSFYTDSVGKTLAPFLVTKVFREEFEETGRYERVIRLFRESAEGRAYECIAAIFGSIITAYYCFAFHNFLFSRYHFFHY